MSDQALKALREKWKTESDKAQTEAMANGAPPGVVTREYMRFLVFEWIEEIEAARLDF